ncbi:MAG: hypothetical protein WC372_07300 [Candidatus Neomarinimicrobiota bacterium]|jgi:hypothetical protein
MRDFNRDTLVGFRNALEAGVVREPAWHVALGQKWSTAASLAAGSAPAPAFPGFSSFQQAAQQPGNLLHWEATFGLQMHPGAWPYDHWIVELARYGCGDSETAVIKSFEQYYTIPREGYCCPPWWGDPYLLYPDVLRWHFRTQPFTGDAGSIPPWNVVGGSGELPGEPHRETPVFDDLWFPAGSPPSQNIHISIASKTLLRVLIEVPPMDLQPAVAAKIRGFVFRAFLPVNTLALKAIW